MGVRVGALVALLLASFGGAAAQEAAPPLCGQVSFAAGRQQLPVSPDWLQHTRVLVNDGSGRRAVPSKAGRFCFHGLDPNEGYLLTVASNEYIFPSLYAECDQTSHLWSAQPFNLLSGPADGMGANPEFRPISRVEAYDVKPPFNPLGMLKNPMVIIALISMGMMFIMPMLTDGLSEEEKKELAQSNPMSAEGGLMGMLSSLSAPPEPAKKAPAKK